MTTLREAAQMALQALQESKPIDIDDPAAFYRSAHAIEALRVALENEFNPDWDAMAVMVEEQQRMAKRIEELESALAQPETPYLTGARLFREGKGISFIQTAVRTDADIGKALQGWEEMGSLDIAAAIRRGEE